MKTAIGECGSHEAHDAHEAPFDGRRAGTPTRAWPPEAACGTVAPAAAHDSFFLLFVCFVAD